jgi:hypothetical protein
MTTTAEAASAGVTYRVVRELGSRFHHAYAAIREPNELVVVQRFIRTPTHGGTPQKDVTVVTAEAMALLLRDARCLAKNWHPNVARVRHVDLVGAELFIASEMVDGVTLADLLQEAAARRTNVRDPVLPLPLLVRILVDVLGGLHGLHGLRDAMNTPLDAIHGELCPSNIVVGKDGVARLVGVFRPRPAKVGAGSEALGYASPEALDAGGTGDVRTDLYAVGVILWEALTGRRLWGETDPARIRSRQREEELVRPELPDASPFARLADVAMRALSFDPALRHKTSSEMATELRRIAGTRIAPGSAVAQTVIDIAGDRIRARRAELDPVTRRRMESLAPPPSEEEWDPMESDEPTFMALQAVKGGPDVQIHDPAKAVTPAPAVAIRTKEEAKEEAARKAEAKAEPPKEEAKADAPKEEAKTDAPKEEAKADAPKEEAKADAPKEDAKADAPKEEAKTEAPKEEAKADAPKEEAKADAPKPPGSGPTLPKDPPSAPKVPAAAGSEPKVAKDPPSAPKIPAAPGSSPSVAGAKKPWSPPRPAGGKPIDPPTRPVGFIPFAKPGAAKAEPEPAADKPDDKPLEKAAAAADAKADAPAPAAKADAPAPAAKPDAAAPAAKPEPPKVPPAAVENVPPPPPFMLAPSLNPPGSAAAAEPPVQVIGAPAASKDEPAAPVGSLEPTELDGGLPPPTNPVVVAAVDESDTPGAEVVPMALPPRRNLVPVVGAVVGLAVLVLIGGLVVRSRSHEEPTKTTEATPTSTTAAAPATGATSVTTPVETATAPATPPTAEATATATAPEPTASTTTEPSPPEPTTAEPVAAAPRATAPTATATAKPAPVRPPTTHPAAPRPAKKKKTFEPQGI